jgi:hypothetical protein
LDGIKLGYQRSTTNYAGSQGGTEYTWTVPQDLYITDVYLSGNPYFETIRFVTDYGNESPTYGAGKNRLAEKQYSVEYGRKLVGMRIYIQEFITGI